MAYGQLVIRTFDPTDTDGTFGLHIQRIWLLAVFEHISQLDLTCGKHKPPPSFSVPSGKVWKMTAPTPTELASQAKLTGSWGS